MYVCDLGFYNVGGVLFTCTFQKKKKVYAVERSRGKKQSVVLSHARRENRLHTYVGDMRYAVRA